MKITDLFNNLNKTISEHTPEIKDKSSKIFKDTANYINDKSPELKSTYLPINI